MSPEIFLSYATVKDLDGTVTAFHTALDMAIKGRFDMDASVFMDKRSIRAGDAWENNISTSLASSKVLLVLLSPVWLTRKWCLAEYNIFKSTHNNDQNKGVIIPLLFVDTELRNAPDDESKRILNELKALNPLNWKTMKNDRGYSDSEKLRTAMDDLADLISDRIWEVSE